MPTELPFAADFLDLDWQLLLACCAATRDAEKIASSAGQVRQLDSFFSLAEEHRVIPRVARAFADLADSRIPAALAERLRSRQRTQVVFALAMTAELFYILEHFRRENIESVVIKGPALAQRAYGDPAARQYVDLDLLIRHADIGRAVEALIAGGYESEIPAQAIRSGKVPGEYIFRRPGTSILFELHTEHSFRYFPKALPINSYFRDRILLPMGGGQAAPVLAPEHEFVLLCVHGAKHFWERLFWISDIAAMMRAEPPLDWPVVRRSATVVGANRMARVALLLAERTLGMAIPAEMRHEVEGDPACSRLVNKIGKWLPYAGHATPRLLQRASFRYAIADNSAAGAAYLARLTFSSTHEDWSADIDGPGAQISESVRRPFRLARKYRGRDS